MAERTVPAKMRRSSAAAKPRAAARATTAQRAAQALLKRRTDTLFSHFSAALAGDVEAIHQLRVSGRRLRAGLLLLAAKPEGRLANKAHEQLRGLTRTAGFIRDLDVLGDLYDERLHALPRRSAEQRRLRKRLRDARRRGHARMASALLDADIAGLRADLAKLTARSAPSLPILFERFRSICDRQSERLAKGLQAVGAMLDPAALHALRRRARRLRFAVEVMRELGAVDADATKPWKSLQDLIGALHDCDMLRSWFVAQAEGDRKRGRDDLAAVDSAEAAWARGQVERAHDRFLAARPLGIVDAGLAMAAGARPPSGTAGVHGPDGSAHQARRSVRTASAAPVRAASR